MSHFYLRTTQILHEQQFGANGCKTDEYRIMYFQLDITKERNRKHRNVTLKYLYWNDISLFCFVGIVSLFRSLVMSFSNVIYKNPMDEWLKIYILFPLGQFAFDFCQNHDKSKAKLISVSILYESSMALYSSTN